MDGKEDASAPMVSDEGVDLTVVRWLLDQSPSERLRRLEEALRSLAELRHERAR